MAILKSRGLFLSNATLKTLPLQSISRIYLSVTVLFALLGAVFYLTPLREQTENLFYDLRTIIKPDRENFKDLVVVTIADPDPEQGEGNLSASELSKLAFADVGALLNSVLNSNPKLVGVLLYPSIFDYDSPSASEFAIRVAADDRIMVGTMGLDTEYPSVRKIPAPLSQISDRLFGLETFRNRRHQTIRQMPINSYRGMAPTILFPLAVAGKLRGEFYKSSVMRSLAASNWEVQWFKPNYANPARFSQISAEELMAADHQKLVEILSDKLVLIAPIYYRERAINNDQIFFNSPWQREGDDPRMGRSLTWLHASSIQNLTEERQLKTPRGVIGWMILQSLAMAFLSGVVWYFGAGVAGLSLIFLWSSFLFAHSVIVSQFAWLVPISDTAVLSLMSTMMGCIWRIQHEGRLRSRQQLETQSRRKMAQIQSRFLDDFAGELLETNARIAGEAADLFRTSNPEIQSAIDRFVVSNREFEEYLRSIRDFAGLSAEQVRIVRNDTFRIKDVVGRIAAHFELKCQTESVRIVVEVSDDLVAKSDERMFEAILFNFISNAVKYSPRNGEVLIRARKRQRIMRLSVRDHGPGIPHEFRERIFEKFYRVRDDRNVAIKGNGLGLYLCRYFADRIGGKLGLETEVGQGSEFWIEIKS
jgi:signal transduction histidine kinase